MSESAVRQSRLDLTMADGPLDLHLSQPDRPGAAPAIVLYMDAFGIRPALLGMASRLAARGFVVAVPNLYYRTPFAPFDGRAVSVDGPERERFRGLISSITRAMVMSDTAAVLERLAALPQVAAGPFGALGYCMGGGYALSAAGTFPGRCAVAASFHGGSLATDKPDSPHRLAGRMQARVYVGAAEIDPTFPPEQQARLAQALAAAGVAHQIEIYPQARHGFAVTGHLAYDQASADRHWQRLDELFSLLVPAPGPAGV